MMLMTRGRKHAKEPLFDRLKKHFRRLAKKKIPLLTKNVSYSYNNKRVLKNVNSRVHGSKIVAVVGKSGSGKSTFLNLIAGVIAGNYTGEIKILGKNRLYSKDDIGYVPQEISLIPDLTIAENLIYLGALCGIPKEKALKRGASLLKKMRMSAPETAYPHELSGGEKVRLNIAVSLLHNPKIIILDEPFVGLDFYNRKLLWQFLEQQKKAGKSIVLTTHLLTESEAYADKIVILKDGNVFLHGKVDQIKQKLHTHYILEIKFKHLSQKNTAEIKEYCNTKTAEVLDIYSRDIMFSIDTEGQKNYLLRHLDRLKLNYKVISFREPNLDEIFLRTRI